MPKPRIFFVALAPVLVVSPFQTARAQEPPPVVDTRQAPEPARTDPALVRRVLVRLAREDPAVDRVVRAALEHVGRDPGRARDLASRARWAGLVPRVRVGVRRGQGWDLSGLQAAEDDVRLSTDDELSLQGTLTFDLDRLVYAPQESTLLREERARETAQAEVVRGVVGAYFERRRLRAEAELGLATDIETHVRIQELTALIDAFTGGAFSRMMATE